MAYELAFTAYDDAGWYQAIALFDDNTGLALAQASDAAFELRVSDDCGSTLLEASTADGTITKPEPNVIAWRFDKDAMGALDPARTYRVGCRMTTPGESQPEVTPLFTGTLVLLDGGF